MARTLAFPVRLTTDGQFLTVEQDSDPDILGSARMALLCPQGHRTLMPEYGRPSVEFTPAAFDRVGALRNGLLRDDPRLIDVTATEDVDRLLGEFVSDVTLQGARG